MPIGSYHPTDSHPSRPLLESGAELDRSLPVPFLPKHGGGLAVHLQPLRPSHPCQNDSPSTGRLAVNPLRVAQPHGSSAPALQEANHVIDGRIVIPPNVESHPATPE